MNALDTMLEELQAARRGEVVGAERARVPILEEREVRGQTRLRECRGRVRKGADEACDGDKFGPQRITRAVATHLWRQRRRARARRLVSRSFPTVPSRPFTRPRADIC